MSPLPAFATNALQVPHQSNGYDCGVFMLMYAEHVLGKMDVIQTLAEEDLKRPTLNRLITGDVFNGDHVQDKRVEFTKLLDGLEESYKKMLGGRKDGSGENDKVEQEKEQQVDKGEKQEGEETGDDDHVVAVKENGEHFTPPSQQPQRGDEEDQRDEKGKDQDASNFELSPIDPMVV